jgi:flagellar protein FliO/FliZ
MEWMSFGLSFLLVLLTMGALYFLFHRFVLGGMPRRAEPRIRIAETLAVGPRQKILLLRINDREVLVGITGQTMCSLSEWPCAPESEFTGDSSASSRPPIEAGRALLGFLGKSGHRGGSGGAR